MNLSHLTAWISAHSIVAGAVALVVAVLVAWAVAGVRRLSRRTSLADVITVAVALAATVYAGAGSWHYLDKAMHYPADLRLFLVAVFEGAVIASGLRARRNIAGTGAAGADGVALWVFTVTSGLLAASVSAGLREAVGRVLVPLGGAWLWERLLAPERRAHKGRRSAPVRWRITPERVFVFLRLADAVDTDVSAVDAGRRVSRYLKATDRAARSWRRPWSPAARADRARMRLTHHALMHGDPAGVHEALSEAAFTDALTRLGIGSRVSQGGESPVSQGGLLWTPQHPGFAQAVASLPPAVTRPLTHHANGRRVAPATRPARRQAAVTARVGVDFEHVKQTYLNSVADGSALSTRDLADATGVSQSTAARAIRIVNG